MKEKQDLKLEQLDTIGIMPDDYVRVTKMNHITEIKYVEHVNVLPTVKKLSNESYLVLATGEIKDYSNTSKTRADNSMSMRKTLKKLRYLINNNFIGGRNELFVTLTYAKNMTDHIQLGRDFKNFWLRFTYKFPNAEYLRISEPQARGAWHLHVLIKNVNYVENQELANLWTHGFVKVNSINGVDNIGAYLTAYLADIPMDDLDGYKLTGDYPVIEKEMSDGTKKKFVKGARLVMYPRGMNYFSKSKGIIYPETKTMKYLEAKKRTSSGKLVYQKNTTIENDGFTNHIRTEFYNSKKKI